MLIRQGDQSLKQLHGHGAGYFTIKTSQFSTSCSSSAAIELYTESNTENSSGLYYAKCQTKSAHYLEPCELTRHFCF